MKTLACQKSQTVNGDRTSAIRRGQQKRIKPFTLESCDVILTVSIQGEQVTHYLNEWNRLPTI